MSETCDYCGTTDLVYELRSDRGPVRRCVPCLAIEQGQQSLSTPYDRYEESDVLGEESLRRSYERARDWFRILARWRSDEALLERDPDATGTVGESTREFLTNVMGSAAFYPPSEIIESGGDPGQSTLGDLEEADLDE